MCVHIDAVATVRRPADGGDGEPGDGRSDRGECSDRGGDGRGDRGSGGGGDV
ncbi:hypothetical protein [Nonomuraea turcica]|uniref:hypothetical protein n=1 Tax=Nonomuraea sp. G32 TaxID=3067274 RepID=UPI00273BB634|nr:hypothetical protein [Nonomuraea sp. G32]MDP4509948.1 hypothetical protein [Nonomuraea sp. G32]